MHQVVAAALLRDPGQVLLCFRSSQRRWYPAVWDFPGGHVEADETPVQALCREVLEEVGVSLRSDTLAENPDLRLVDEDLDLSLWAVRAWEGEARNCAPEEHDEVRWFDLDEARFNELAHPDYARWLASMMPTTSGGLREGGMC